MTKRDKDRTKMSQMKIKITPHTKELRIRVGGEDPGLIWLANRLIPREGKRRPYKTMPDMS